MKWTIKGHIDQPPGPNEGKQIMLIREQDYSTIPDGTVLFDIFGDEYVKGQDYIDNDTRGGFLAFGMMITDKSL